MMKNVILFLLLSWVAFTAFMVGSTFILVEENHALVIEIQEVLRAIIR